MRLNAAEIIKAIGDGVAAALATNKLFLGVEVDAYQNANIHPEYVTTVEVAKKLTAPDRQVSLEAHMKELRKQARFISQFARKGQKPNMAAIDTALVNYKFGKKDSERLDILVRPSDPLEMPMLFAEAKLGARSFAGITKDVNRVVRLLSMFNDLNLLHSADVYAAVVFHSMDEGHDGGGATVSAQTMVSAVQDYLETITAAKPWLHSKVGLLTQGAQIQPLVGYVEHYDDETIESVFAKESFAFAPGMVLLGNALDITTAQL